jgi:hypothetical protein
MLANDHDWVTENPPQKLPTCKEFSSSSTFLQVPLGRRLPIRHRPRLSAGRFSGIERIYWLSTATATPRFPFSLAKKAEKQPLRPSRLPSPPKPRR